MKPRHLLFCSASLVAASLPAQTVIEPDGSASSSERTLHVRVFGRLLSAIDSNRDGIVSSQELRLAPITLTAYDLDEDGFLQPDEIRPSRPSHARKASFRPMVLSLPRPPSPESALMLVLDANHDGVLQPIEVANATSSLQRLDGNRDGALTADELKATVRVNVIAANL